MPTTSTNMGLTVPIASTGVTGTGDPGPGYATNISNDFTNVIDSHDHSSGKGVQITPAGINVNADLSIGTTNNLTNIRAARFTNQASGLNLAGDVGEVYVKSGDLWYVNSAGTQVQVTAGSSLATGITGPAGANGANGAAGAVGLFTGTVFVPTAYWQPTGQFSGTYRVTSWVSTVSVSSGMWTGIPAAYVINQNYGTTVSVLANIIGYDGNAQAADVDLKGTFIGASGGNATYVGTFTTCYNQTTPVASGWQFTLRPTGTSIQLMVSAPTGGPSGSVNFVCTTNITERGNP